MSETPTKIDAKGAVTAARKIFDEFFNDAQKRNVLLEGVEYLDDEGCWLVTIGFDVGREKKTGSQFGFGSITYEPVREIREIKIGLDGGFLGMPRA